MNFLKKYGLELIIIGIFFAINMAVVVYFDSEIRSEERSAEYRKEQQFATKTDAEKNKSKEADEEKIEQEKEAEETEKKEEKEEKEPEKAEASENENKKPEKPKKVKPVKTPKKKPALKKTAADKDYDKIVAFYKDLSSNYYSEDQIYSEIVYLEYEIPEEHRPGKGGRDMAQVVINEIFARYGYSFTKPEMQSFYKKKDWYRKIKKKEPDINKVVNKIAKKNRILRENYDILVRIRESLRTN